MNASGLIFSEAIAFWLSHAAGTEAALAYSFAPQHSADNAGDDSSVGCSALAQAEVGVYGKGLFSFLLGDVLEAPTPRSRRIDRLNSTRASGWLPVRAALARGLVLRTAQQETVASVNDSSAGIWVEAGGGAGAGFQLYCVLGHREILLATNGGGGGGGLNIPFSGAPSFGGGGGGGLQLRHFLNASTNAACSPLLLSPWESFGGGSGCNSVADGAANASGISSNDTASASASSGVCAAQIALGGATAS